VNLKIILNEKKDIKISKKPANVAISEVMKKLFFYYKKIPQGNFILKIIFFTGNYAAQII